MDKATEPRSPGCTLPEPGQLLDCLRDAADEVWSTMVTTVASLVESRTIVRVNEVRDRHDETKVDVEAVVEFVGDHCGAVVLRCCAAGALDIARGLLMLAEDEFVDVNEIKDALGECANMVSGAMKAKALDAIGRFTLEIPRIETYRHQNSEQHWGTLVYRLVEGRVAIEIWVRQSPPGGSD